MSDVLFDIDLAGQEELESQKGAAAMRAREWNYWKSFM